MRTKEELEFYNRARQAYPLVFLVLEAAYDLTWLVATGTERNTLLLKAPSIANSMANFSDGVISHQQGVVTVAM